MAKYLYLILAILGLGIIIYGIILFLAMPAAGAFVIVTGLICVNVGITNNQKIGHTKSTHYGKLLVRRQDRSLKEASRSKAFKITTTLIYISNFILITSMLPDIKNLIGDDLGFVVSALLGLIVTTFYTGFILLFFRTIPSLAVVGLVTWATIVLRMLYYK
jgi:hypothetical protein